MFHKATRQQSKLRLCVSGPSGSGKTFGALTLAKEIKGEGRIALIDTENGSASLYANQFDFDVLNMEPPYSPGRFVESIKSAEQSGYTVIVIDSATHEWEGSGGCLEMNEQTARARFKGNTWSAWSDTNKEHQKFVNALVHSSCHIICTARSKTETAQSEKKIVRLGTKLVQRDNFEYEFTVALDLVHDGHFANALKDRTGLFSVKSEAPITPETGQKILAWLNDGVSADDLLETHLSDISLAEDDETLLDVARTAYNAMRPFGQSYLDKVVAAKDERESELSNNEVSQKPDAEIQENAA